MPTYRTYTDEADDEYHQNPFAAQTNAHSARAGTYANQHQSYSDDNFIDVHNRHHSHNGGADHSDPTTSPSVPATNWHKAWAVFTLLRGIVARSILLWALLESSAEVPFIYVIIVLGEWIGNTAWSWHKDEHFPSSMYSPIHTLTTGRHFTGDFVKSRFDGWLKLRMLLLVVSLNLSVSISVNAAYTPKQRSSPSSPGDIVPASIADAAQQARVIVPLVLEVVTLALNTLFTLLLYSEIMVRLIRWTIFLLIHLGATCVDVFTAAVHRARLLPITLTTYKPYSRSMPLSSLERHLSTNHLYESDRQQDDDYADWGDDQMGLVYWPCYTFMFKWNGF